MNTTLLTLEALSRDQVVLEIDANELAQIQERAKQTMPNAVAKHNYVLNALSLNAVQYWLQNNIISDAETITVHSQQTLLARWSVVSGTPISFGSTQLVIIPSDAIDTAGMSVPQEWVDISPWQPDYYIATQVDLDRRFILLWGYVSSKTVKEKGVFNSSHRYYSLPQDNITLDLESFNVIPEAVSQESNRTAAAVSQVEASTQRESLNQLSTPSIFSPRLDLPFEVWSGLIAQEDWCQELYQQRCAKANLNSLTTNLLEWLKGNFISSVRAGWQDLSDIVNASLQNSPQLQPVLRELKPALRAPGSGVEKGKRIELQQAVNVVLQAAVAPKPNSNDNEYDIIIQLHPDPNQNYLPEGIQFRLIFENQVLQEATSQFQDKSLQLRFTSEPETNFKIEVVSRQNSYVEEFTVS
ncbi:UNVERIFIED_CONTAM: hypothetical protein BEN50_02820 [Euhalothece sp. KZN 001]